MSIVGSISCGCVGAGGHWEMSKNAWKTLNAWKARKPKNIMELGAPGWAKKTATGCRLSQNGVAKSKPVQMPDKSQLSNWSQARKMIISQHRNTIESIRIIHVMCSKRPRMAWPQSWNHNANQQAAESDEENGENRPKDLKQESKTRRESHQKHQDLKSVMQFLENPP